MGKFNQTKISESSIILCNRNTLILHSNDQVENFGQCRYSDWSTNHSHHGLIQCFFLKMNIFMPLSLGRNEIHGQDHIPRFVI